MKNLSELTLTELYYLSNGNTTMNFEEIVPKLKDMSEEDRKNTIGRLIYCMSSGTAGSPIIEMFKTKLNKELESAPAPASTMSMKHNTTPPVTVSDDTDTSDVDDEVVSTAEIVQDSTDDSDDNDK